MTKGPELWELLHLPRSFSPRSPAPGLLECSYCPLVRRYLRCCLFSSSNQFRNTFYSNPGTPTLRFNYSHVQKYTALHDVTHCQQFYLCRLSSSSVIFIIIPIKLQPNFRPGTVSHWCELLPLQAVVTKLILSSVLALQQSPPYLG